MQRTPRKPAPIKHHVRWPAAAIFVLVTAAVVGQSRPWSVWQRVWASAFGQWQVQSLTLALDAGQVTLHMETSAMPVVQGGPAFEPFATNAPLIIDPAGSQPETVTPSAVNCSLGQWYCTIALTLAHPHPKPFVVRSATGGLQEAINYLSNGAGGQVVVDPTWIGTTAMIADVAGSPHIGIVDERQGQETWYDWTASGYVSALSINGPQGGTGSLICSGCTLPSPVINGNVEGGATYVAPTLAAASLTGATALSGALEGTGASAAISGVGVNGLVNLQTFSGSDYGAKLGAALASPACMSGCEITDGDPFGKVETISAADLPVTVNVPVVFHQHAAVRYTGAGDSAGLLYFTPAAQGFSWSCSGFQAPQNFGFGFPAGACGFDIEPSSGSMPGIVIGKSSTATLNTGSFTNEIVTANGNVSDPILGQASGGMSNITLRNIYVNPSSNGVNWSDWAIGFKCDSSSATANGWNNNVFDHIYILGDGVGVGGTGAEVGGGFYFDPGIGGAGCGTAENTVFSNSAIYGINGARSLDLGSQGALTVAKNQFGNASTEASDYTAYIRAGAAGTILSANHWEENNRANRSGASDLGIISSNGIALVGNGFTGSTVDATHSPQQAIYVDGSTSSVAMLGQAVQGYRGCGIAVAPGASTVSISEDYTAGTYSSTGAPGSTSEFCSVLPNGNGALTLASNGDTSVMMSSLSGGTPWSLISSGTGGINAGHFLLYNGAGRQAVLDIAPDNTMTQVNGNADFNGITAASVNATLGLQVNGANLYPMLTTTVAGPTAPLAGNACGDTVTVNLPGATTTMIAVASSPAVFPTVANGLTITAAVTAAGTVTVGFCNSTSSSVTPAAATVQVRVLQ